jgi:Rrf2 family transcriptional regulator, iron-sulfur cluster assembly transcription factor
MFPRSTEYAIRALIYLAAQQPGKLIGAREIAEAEGIPMPFLWKILQRLAARKLVRSFRGVRGGYELARPPQRITIDKILREMGSGAVLNRCLLGFPHCGRKAPCPLRTLCSDFRSRLNKVVRTTTLASLSTPSR